MTQLTNNFDILSICRLFALQDKISTFQPYGNGHINDTFLIRCATANSHAQTQPAYILQRINHHVFKQPLAVMSNIEHVLSHWWGVLQAQGATQLARKCPQLVPAHDGKTYAIDQDGNVWRMFHFIDDTYTVDVIETPQQAYLAAKAFGQFQQHLAALPAQQLAETIPGFHHTRNRFQALIRAIDADSHARVDAVRPEIEFALAHEADTGLLLDLQALGRLPLRVTHNDTKINNVLFDMATGEPLCVVDLDTVMPGLVAYDFGDMVRTAATTVIEDEADISRVDIRMDLFKALAQGYLASAGDSLSDAEKHSLAFGGKLITLEQGIRFLTDYLQGDSYYKTRYAQHNLDRTCNQFALVRAIEANLSEMERLVTR